MLTFVAPAAGTLSFDVRNLGAGTDAVSLTVDNVVVDTIGAGSSFVTRSRVISAGSFVGLSYISSGLASYAEFRNITFTPAAPLAQAVAPSHDQDGDGAEDLLEIALGTDSSSAASRPVTRIVADGGAMVFQFQRPSGLPYRYKAQVSSDLIEWVDLEEVPTVEAAGAYEQVRIAIPRTGKRNFARLSVTPLAD
jgi:hypothetical protein